MEYLLTILIIILIVLSTIIIVTLNFLYQDVKKELLEEMRKDELK